MNSYNSDFLNSIYENDQLMTPLPEVLLLRPNFFGGRTLADRNGNTVLETMPSAAGGETVMFGNGETAHLITDNIYGSSTLDFTGTANDIVGMTSIFSEESFYQNGHLIGTLEPNLMGDGVHFTSSSSDTLFTTSAGLLDGTQVTISPSLIDSISPSNDILESFNTIETISSHISVMDIGSATDVMDGLDFLGWF